MAFVMDRPADLLVARDGRSAALRGPDGRLVIIGLRPEAYTANQWLLRDGDRRDITTARAAAQCDEVGFAATGKQGRAVAIPNYVAAVPDDCSRAPIAISALLLHANFLGPE